MKNSLHSLSMALCYFLFLTLNSFAQAPDWLWAKSAGGSSSVTVNSVKEDASGNSYVAGFFSGSSITFGTTTLTDAGGGDFFLTKYDASGNVLWAKSAGSSSMINSLCLDTSGNAYVTGYFTSSITLGSTTLPDAGNGDIFIAKYDASGNVIWAKSAGGTGLDMSNAISVDASGNLYIAGSFTSPSVAFGSTFAIWTGGGTYDMFFAKYDASGNALWGVGKGANSVEEQANSVVADASGNVYVAGKFGGLLVFGGTSLNSAGSGDIFLAKYDATGNPIWAKSAGGSANDVPYSLCLDASGNVYMTGSFVSGTITFGSTTSLATKGFADMYVAKYDAAGNALWAKSAGGSNIDVPRSISLDASGNAYVAGYFSSSAIGFGTDTLSTAGSYDMFLAKFDTAGNAVWGNAAGGSGDDKAYAVSVNASGNLCIGGYFGSSITFGSTTLTGTGASNLALARLNLPVPIIPTGISALAFGKELKLYPNPFTEKVAVTGLNPSKQTLIKVINLLGMTVKEVIAPAQQDTYTLDLSTLSAGLYFLKCNEEVLRIVKE